jgi:hypothetical protein
MLDPAVPEDLVRHMLETWDDADVLDALDELDVQMTAFAHQDEPRTPEERAAERAAREDWIRADTAV